MIHWPALWRRLAWLVCAIVLVSCGGGGLDDGGALCNAITEQPVDQTVQAGESASFRVGVNGSGASFQWQVLIGNAWTDIAGATSATLTIAAATPAQDGSIFRAIVKVSNGLQLISASARLTVLSSSVASGRCSPSSAAWCQVHPQPAAGDLHALAFNENGTIVAVGDAGAIVRSTDAGITWSETPTSPGGQLLDVIPTPRGAWLVAGEGGIYRSTDDGDQWTQVLATPLPIRAFGNDGLTLLAIGEGDTAWLDASDDGTDWRPVALSASTIWRVVGSNHGGVWLMFGSSGTAGETFFMQRSSDDGRNWAATVPLGWRVNGVAMAGGNIAIAVGTAGNIARSVDTGVTWTELAADPARDLTLNSVVSVSNARFLAVDAGGRVWASDDAGQTWSLTPSGSTGASADVGGANGVIVAVGPGSRIARSGDGGATWRDAGSVYDGSLGGVGFASAGVVIASAGNHTLLRSTDGGSSWATQSVPGTGEGSYNRVAFADTQLGLVAGSNGVLRTTDGGASYTRIDIGTNFLFGVVFVDPSTALVVGDEGTLMRSDDAGQSWGFRESNTRVTLNGIAASNGNAVAVGDAGTVVRIDVAGNSTTVLHPTTVDLFDVSFVGALGLAVGDAGTILRTSDGGLTWSATSSGSARLTGVSFAGAGPLAFAVSSDGAIHRSADAGATWTRSTGDAAGALFGVAFSSADTGLVVGARATILRTTNGGGR